MRPLTDVEVKESETATLECEVSKPDQPASWTKAGKPITAGGRVEIVTEGTIHRLIIKDAKLEDQAEYSISVGDKTSQASVFVEGEILFDYSEFPIWKLPVTIFWITNSSLFLR